ncbi:uncharacterized protein LOC142817474 [Rhipicephalus microplus]|uniref:uncharacterized protein LOC142817474 n=1 Tax=Rhipicephalus microplus TaxID=6941 RepID=UPI003F6BC55B
MPGMVPGMMPRMMPGMMPGMMSGMVPGMVPAAYPGITPGISMVPGALMMPSVLPGVVGFRNRQDLESTPTDWNDTTLTEQATAHGATTMNPFMDIVETFGEVGVGDGLRDFELPSPEGPHNTVGFALDWLMGAGAIVQATASKRQSTRRSLPYFNERGLLQNTAGSQFGTKHSSKLGLKMAVSKHFDLPLPLAESGGVVDASVYHSLFNSTESVNVAPSLTPESTLPSAPISVKALIERTLAATYLEAVAHADVQTRLRVDKFLDDRTHRGSASTSRMSSPGEGGPAVLPESAYGDDISAEYQWPSVLRKTTTRKRRINVTLSFRLPQLPTLNHRSIIIRGMLHDSTYREDRLSRHNKDGRNYEI